MTDQEDRAGDNKSTVPLQEHWTPFGFDLLDNDTQILVLIVDDRDRIKCVLKRYRTAGWRVLLKATSRRSQRLVVDDALAGIRRDVRNLLPKSPLGTVDGRQVLTIGDHVVIWDRLQPFLDQLSVGDTHRLGIDELDSKLR